MLAKVKVLIVGYLAAESGGKTCPTITLVQTAKFNMVVDPGTVENQQEIIDALAKEGLTISDINIVGITHSHIDHYKNIALFPKAKVLEYWGLWDQGRCEDWNENFSDQVQVLKTPGHDYSCLTFFIKTEQGVVAICGDVFWKQDYPKTDPYASDLKKLEESRRLVLQMSHWIVPGHADIYKTTNGHNLGLKQQSKKPAVSILGRCKRCKRAFFKKADRCTCHPWLCYRCCICKFDCDICNCEHKKGL